jgi:transposase
MARRLLVTIWHVLTERVADRHGEPVAVAQKLMRWATHRHTATQQGLSRGHWVRCQLDRLGLGRDLEHVPFGGKRLRLPPPGDPHVVLSSG